MEELINRKIDTVRFITKRRAIMLVDKYHYSKVLPKLNKYYIGGFSEGELVGVFTLGWGTRPMHTIRKLFPSLTTKDYFECGKLCVADFMPRNSESTFISKVIELVKKELPKIKIIFSWADGIMGKPGYVYQASNFFYGGFIWTHAFLDENNVRVHVRSLQGMTKTDEKKFGDVSFKKVNEKGYRILFGKQFRYVFPVCDRREWKRLLKESTVTWERGNYPKDKDLEFFIKDEKGKRKVDFVELSTTTYTKEKYKGQTKIFDVV